MHLEIKLPEAWNEIPLSLREKYVEKYARKGGVTAATTIIKGMCPKAYAILLKHGTVDQLSAVIDEVDSIDDTQAIIPSFIFKGKVFQFPKQHMEHTPLMVFAKCDELYGYIRSSIEDNNGTRATDYMYQLLLALTAPTLDYQIYSKYVDQPLSKSAKKKLAPYLSVALRYFTANKIWIHEQYGELLFDGEGGESIGIRLGWHGTAMSIAESGAFGNLANVYETYLHTILLFLVKKKQDAEQIKRSKKNNNYT